MFGGRLLMVSHVGRQTGKQRATVLEVISSEPDPPTWYVAAAWGIRSDWFRNLKRNPRATVTVGSRSYEVVARVVEFPEAVRVHGEYVRAHPWTARLIGRMLGIDLTNTDPAVLAERIPLVALTAEDAGVRARDVVAAVLTTRAQTQATYDRIAPHYEAVEGFWERRARVAGLEALTPERGESVLEIGCGPGNSLVELARAVGPQGRVVGVDLAFNMCALAQQRLEQKGLTATGTAVQGDAVHLPFASGSFGAGYMSFTLELFDTPEIPTVLAECRRVLLPGGRLAVVALSKEQPGPLMQRAYERGHERFPRWLDCRPIYVERALDDGGFTVVAHRVMSLWGLPVGVVVGQT